MRRLLILLPLLILGCVGWGYYLISTVDVNTMKGDLEIVHPECVIVNSLFTRTYYMQYVLLPSEKTKPDCIYRVVVDNGSVRREDKVYWTQLEYDIKEAKEIRHKISQDEFTALGMKPQYGVSITEVRAERDGNYLLWPVIYVGILGLVGACGVSVLGKPKIRARYKRPFGHHPIKTTPMSDDELAKRCMECTSIKSTNGVFKCGLETCKY